MKRLLPLLILCLVSNFYSLAQESSTSGTVVEQLGIDFVDIDKSSENINGVTKGVLVKKIKKGVVSKTRMQDGFIITKINEIFIINAEQFQTILDAYQLDTIVFEGVYSGYEGNYRYELTVNPQNNISRGFLGVNIQIDEVTERQKISLGFSYKDGALVLDVASGSPAEFVGIKPMDVIVKVNNDIVTNGKEFRRILSKYKQGEKLEITFYRNNSTNTTVTAILTAVNTTLFKASEDKVDRFPPTIVISDPQINRGFKVTASDKKISISGKAIDESGIYEVMVNGVEAKVDASGNFSATVPLAIGENNFTVTATDIKMNKGDYRFTVSRTAAENIETPIIPVSNNEMVQGGKYYALIIGIQEYEDPTIQDLEEPVSDALSIYNVLTTKYSFDKQNATILKNPTRQQIFDALENLSRKISGEDNLLVFYAGHGNWDEKRKQGYWYPSDAKRDNRASWLTNADLKEYVSTIPSKHTLLITDACFAGSIFKSRSMVSTASMAVKQLYELPSRKAMTSGSLKEVPDKSVFIEYLVKRLTQNAEKFLSAEQLFSSFRVAVINNSANGQVPQYGEIKEAGDEGGDFIFIKR